MSTKFLVTRSEFVVVEAKDEDEALNKAIQEDEWYPDDGFEITKVFGERLGKCNPLRSEVSTFASLPES